MFWNPDRPGGSTRDPTDPGLEPVRVEVKTRLGVGPVKPGRPGGSTRDPVHPVKPGWDPVYFFLVLAAIKRRRYKSLSQPTKNHVPLFLFNFPHYLFIRPYHLFPLSLFLSFFLILCPIIIGSSVIFFNNRKVPWFQGFSYLSPHYFLINCLVF